ncbi:MgtC/SapB family protein [Microcoleus sp. ZQ-A2]
MILSVLGVTTTAFIDANDWLGLTSRILLACLVGGAIGWDRQRAGKPGGLRTHMLVSLGAAIFVMIPLLTSDADSSDALSRAVQGVATGVGFLGAGEILQQPSQTSSKPRIKGLTSAATIWLTAALGIVAGCGFWQLILVATLITLFVLSIVKQLERVVFHRED